MTSAQSVGSSGERKPDVRGNVSLELGADGDPPQRLPLRRETRGLLNMFAAALLQELLNAVSMTWAGALANPWIFLVVAGAVLLRWLEARVRRVNADARLHGRGGEPSPA